MEEMIKSKKFKKFVRPLSPEAMRITKRDIELVKTVARYRYASSDSLVVAVRHMQERGEKDDRVKRRLTKLFRNDYLAKPAHQLKYHGIKNISQAHVYGLSAKGAQLVKQYFEHDLIKPRWRQLNASASHDFIWHTADVADVAIRFRAHVHGVNSYQHISENDMLKLAHPDMHKEKNPWRFRAEFAYRGGKKKIGIQPDHVVGIKKGEGKTAKRMNFVVEVDRETMTVIRGERLERELLGLQAMFQDEIKGKARNHLQNKLSSEVEKLRRKLIDKNVQERQSSFLKKFAVYFEAYKAGWHQERFNWQNFRVLTVTQSQSHIDRMREGLHIVTGGKLNSMFLFATIDEFKQAENVWAMEWQDGLGERVVVLG